MIPITISVSEECIRLGIPSDPACCPVAVAMKANGILNPLVDGDSIQWESNDGSFHEMETPRRVRSFIESVDNAGDDEYDLPTPFTFELRDESV